MRTGRMIRAVEAHAEGEGGRVITGGMPVLHRASVFDKMEHMARRHDDLRLLMLREPRGNPALCCNALVPPCDPRADAGFIVMEQTEYPPMSGSTATCVATAPLETGILPMVEPMTILRLEAPARLIEVRATCRGGRVERVDLTNVPAFAAHLDVPLEVPGPGCLTRDFASGDIWFVIADASRIGLSLDAANGAEIVRAAEAVREAALAAFPVADPDNPALRGPTIAQFTCPPTDPATHGRGAVTVSSGARDPSRPGALTGALGPSLKARIEGADPGGPLSGGHPQPVRPGMDHWPVATDAGPLRPVSGRLHRGGDLGGVTARPSRHRYPPQVGLPANWNRTGKE